MTPDDRDRRRLVLQVTGFVLLAALLGLVWPWLIR